MHTISAVTLTANVLNMHMVACLHQAESPKFSKDNFVVEMTYYSFIIGDMATNVP